MFCSLDWLCEHAAVARVHPDGGLGDPWTWSCTVFKQGDVAVLLGAKGAPTPPEARALLAALRQAGFTSRMHERHYGDGTVLKVERKLL